VDADRWLSARVPAAAFVLTTGRGRTLAVEQDPGDEQGPRGGAEPPARWKREVHLDDLRPLWVLTGEQDDRHRRCDERLVLGSSWSAASPCRPCSVLTVSATRPADRRPRRRDHAEDVGDADGQRAREGPGASRRARRDRGAVGVAAPEKTAVSRGAGRHRDGRCLAGQGRQAGENHQGAAGCEDRGVPALEQAADGARAQRDRADDGADSAGNPLVTSQTWSS